MADIQAGNRVTYSLPEHKHCNEHGTIREAIVEKVKDGDVLNLLVLIEPDDFTKDGRISEADLDENDKPIRTILGKVVHSLDGSFFYVNNVQQGMEPNQWFELEY